MTYLIDLNIEGHNFKMNGTLEELKNKIKDIGGTDISIFDSRVEDDKKQIRFTTSNGFYVTGEAVKA